MKKQAVIFIVLIFILPIMALEGFMIMRYGAVPQQPDLPQFRYQYLEIYQRFFKKVGRDGRLVYMPQRPGNDAVEFPVVKAPDTVRIFIVGGSMANKFGDFAFGDILENLIPDKEFEVICCGMAAYDSYRTYLVERDLII